MTQKDKELLLKDLCMRLPYGVVCEFKRSTLNVLYNNIYNDTLTINNIEYVVKGDSVVRPYLRPMSSMTQEEIKTYHSYCECNDGDFTGEILYFDTIESFDYLTSIHIDYRGLIPMGLALEAPENMYKIK